MKMLSNVCQRIAQACLWIVLISAGAVHAQSTRDDGLYLPTTPTGLTGSTRSSTQVSLSWTASTDSSGVLAGYQIFRNGALLGTTRGTTYSDTTTTCATTCTYTVRAYDLASPPNVSGQSSAWSVTTPITIPLAVPTAQSAGLPVTTAASIYQITDANGNSLSSLYRTATVPAICGPGSGNGPCNYVVVQTYGSRQIVREDTNGLNTSLVPGYSTGSGSDYKSTYATAAVYGN